MGVKMKIFVISVILVLTSVYKLHSQNLSIKKLFDTKGDYQSVVFYRGHQPDFFGEPEIIFAERFGNICNIFTSRFNNNDTTFEKPVAVTEDSAMNINPFGIINDNNRRFIVFQTNRNGNWDIAYKEFINNGWSNIKYIANSELDETNPKAFFTDMGNTPDTLLFNLVYEKAGSIINATVNDTGIVYTTVFISGDSVLYSRPAGAIRTTRYFPITQTKYFAAVRQQAGKGSEIVVKGITPGSGSADIKIIDSTGNCNNPQFMPVNSPTELSYQKMDGSYNNIFFDYDWEKSDSTTSKDKLIENPDGNISDYRFYSHFVLSKESSSSLGLNNYPPSHHPYAFRFERNDSVFIRMTHGNPYSPPSDSAVYTNSKSSLLALGPVGGVSLGGGYYIIWKDTSSEGTSLYGGLLFYMYSGIHNNSGEDQNVKIDLKIYPNPFNSSTQIRYSFPLPGYVKLRLFNVNGQLVRTLKDEYLNPGSYLTSFSGRDLASGIYFVNFIITYPVPGNRFTSETQKMILLK